AELRAREDLDAALAFSLGRAAEDEQDFAEARRLFERASDLGSPGVRTRAEAHLAYLDYYAGRCEPGFARARAAARSGHGIAARGDPVALTFFREADRHWGGSSRSFGRWLQYVWAVTLRNLGNISGAHNLRLASGIKVPWEEPLFDLAEGSPVTPPDAVNCPTEDMPFRLAARGVVFYAQGRFDEAAHDLRLAIREFERCEFHHERRGAALGLAAVELAAGELPVAETIVRRE